MIIVLDATALRQYLPFDSPLFRQLGTFVRGSGHRLVVPQVVHRELNEHIAGEFRKVERAFTDFKRQTRYRGDVTPPGEAEQKELTASLNQRLSELGAEVVPIPGISHEIVIDRIYDRKAPFRQNEKNKDAGYKDFLIWNTVLKLARTNSDQEVVLVTADRDFTKDGELHPHLAADADGLKVRLVSDLKTFHDDEVRPWFPTDEGLKSQLIARLKEITAFIEEEFELAASGFYVDPFDVDLPYSPEGLRLERIDRLADVSISTVSRLGDEEVSVAIVLGGSFIVTDEFTPEDPWQLNALEDAWIDYTVLPWNKRYAQVELQYEGAAEIEIVFEIEDGEIEQPTALEITEFTAN